MTRRQAKLSIKKDVKMKITCGTDIIEIERIKECIDELKETFINKIYTEKEKEYCESKKMAKYQHYAARFAAKEAIFKAISCELKDKYEITWQNAEIVNDENGRPKVNFINKQIENLESIEISISHCKEYAVANVIVIWNN